MKKLMICLCLSVLTAAIFGPQQYKWETDARRQWREFAIGVMSLNYDADERALLF